MNFTLGSESANLLLAVVIQFALVLVWGASLTQRVKELERELEPFRKDIKNLLVSMSRIEGFMQGKASRDD